MTPVSYFLIILISTSAVCLIVLTVYIVKLLISATKLTDNINVVTTSVQKEIEPTLKELQEAAKAINSIVAKSGEQVENAKSNISNIVNATTCLGGKLKHFADGILKGLAFGLGIFKK